MTLFHWYLKCGECILALNLMYFTLFKLRQETAMWQSVSVEVSWQLPFYPFEVKVRVLVGVRFRFRGGVSGSSTSIDPGS